VIGPKNKKRETRVSLHAFHIMKTAETRAVACVLHAPIWNVIGLKIKKRETRVSLHAFHIMKTAETRAVACVLHAPIWNVIGLKNKKRETRVSLHAFHTRIQGIILYSMLFQLANERCIHQSMA
jgi:hypothetical protein